MKKNLRIHAVILCLLIFATACVPAGLAEENPGIIYSMFHLKLRRNTIMARYGVTILFDGIEVGHVEQGEQITFGAYMHEGVSHFLLLRADDPDVPDHEWTISSVQNGTAFTCRIQTHRRYVDIPETLISVNGTTMISVSPDIERMVRLGGTVIEIGTDILMNHSGN